MKDFTECAQEGLCSWLSLPFVTYSCIGNQKRSHTQINLPWDQEGYDRSGTTYEKFSSGRIHWCRDPSSIYILPWLMMSMLIDKYLCVDTSVFSFKNWQVICWLCHLDLHCLPKYKHWEWRFDFLLALDDALLDYILKSSLVKFKKLTQLDWLHANYMLDLIHNLSSWWPTSNPRSNLKFISKTTQDIIDEVF